MLFHREATAEETEQAGLFHRLYIAETLNRPKLLVLVHGRAGDARVKWVFTRGLNDLVEQEPGMVVVAPQAPLEDAIGGYSWWTVEKGSRGGKATKDDLLPALEKLRTFIERVAERYDVSEVIASGFSQGAGLISTLSLQRPELFSRVALLAGFIPSVVLEDPKSFELSDGPLPNYFIAHGTEDKIVPVTAAERARDFLESRSAQVSYLTEPVGHKVGSQTLKAFRGWLQEG